MLKHLVEEARYVEITGFRNVNVEKPDELLKTVRGGKLANFSVQFFSADVIATWEHLYFAVLDALMVFRTKRNISNSLAVEIMLYASAQRQIKKAIGLVGVTAGCADIAVVVVGESQAVIKSALAAISRHFGKKPDEHVLELSPAKTQNIRKAFAISENELAVVTKQGNVERALVDLVVERMALLSTRL